ncbi:MAG: signal peptide peptidase SppA [Planctomycetota bacterium]|nr:MAG: signal peptide peptidase SppA [Planctomycetota bacterium]
MSEPTTFISILKKFWEYVESGRRHTTNAIFLGIVMFFGLCFLILILTPSTKTDVIINDSALKISFSGPIVEQESGTKITLEMISNAINKKKTILLHEVLKCIALAKENPKIKGIVLDIQGLRPSGISKLQVINKALIDFKSSGKKIIAIGDMYSQEQYFLASTADEILLHPMGGIELSGFGRYRSYYKSFLDKLKIKVHIFRVGTFKSALEPFFRDSMSDAAKESNLGWLNILWGQYKQDLKKNRPKVKIENIDEFITKFDEYLKESKGDLGQLALKHGLVDALQTREELSKKLIKIFGENVESKTYNSVSMAELLKEDRNSNLFKFPSSTKIGIVYAKGIILDGDHPKGTIGGETLSKLIRKARKDKSVKALVLRIDSGGGSVFASELIRKEVELFKKSGRPVIASFGSIAASGGYWIATPADEIWASPTTITGSIGIFGAFPTIEKSLGSIGIYTDGVGTTPLANAYDPTRELNPTMAKSVQQVINKGYDMFLDLVAKSRKMKKEDVDKIAQGRVWAGITAKEIGLVDHLGDLSDAIKAAAKRANLTDYDITIIEKDMTKQEIFFKQLADNMGKSKMIEFEKPKESIEIKLLNIMKKEFSFWLQLNDPQNIYAHSLINKVP